MQIAAGVEPDGGIVRTVITISGELPGMRLALVLAGPVRRRLRGHPEGPRGTRDVRGGRRGPNMTEIGGLCGLLPRRRRQPSGGGARAEPIFSTKGEAQ